MTYIWLLLYTTLWHKTKTMTMTHCWCYLMTASFGGVVFLNAVLMMSFALIMMPPTGVWWWWGWWLVPRWLWWLGCTVCGGLGGGAGGGLRTGWTWCWRLYGWCDSVGLGSRNAGWYWHRYCLFCGGQQITGNLVFHYYCKILNDIVKVGWVFTVFWESLS